MSGVPPQLLEAVRERSRIADLFPTEQLRRRGREFLTLCPWHADHNASLTVSPRTNRVHCFVCNRGADAIGWLQDREGLSFRDAVEELARRYGIPVPAADPEEAARLEAEQRERRRLLSLREEQQQRFQQALAKDQARDGPAAAFLRQRGIRPETARFWGLGLNGARLMLPIRDGQGRCCGFSGRSIRGEEPKYKNTAGDVLFRKSELLFGLDRAYDSIRRSGEAVLVEGPLDVIQLHQGGIENTVASMGTVLSVEQGQRLLRLGSMRLSITYDADAAGTNATARLIREWRPQAISGALDLQVVTLPPGSDPDALIRKIGPEDFRALLADSIHWLSWELERLLEDLLHKPEDLFLLQRCEREGAELLAQLPRGSALLQRAERRLWEALGVVPVVDGGVPLASEKGGHRSGASTTPVSKVPPPSGHTAPDRESRIDHSERRALRLFLHSPECREAIVQLSFRHPLHREAIGLLWHLHLRLRRAGGENGVDGVSAANGLVGAVMELAPHMEAPLAGLITALVAGGGVVGSALAGDPGAELGVVLEALEPVGGVRRLDDESFAQQSMGVP
ncbi:MAG: CHC2 zinc finger domain-containing protein [Cyanobacteriota bacterium]|nr:CHC2 zinc finger domain-containing protein [Cyanobacteriota bacterium]